MIRFSAILLILISLYSCEEVIDWANEGEVVDGISVECVLTNQLHRQEIRITSLYGDLNGVAEGISGAEIKVGDVNQVYDFTEVEDAPGLYQSNDEFAVYAGRKYFLRIKIGEETYEALTMPVASSWMRTFQLAQYGDSDSLYYPNLGVEYQVNEQAMFDFNIDWSHIQNSGKNKASLRHYAFNKLNIGQIFGPAREQIYFPRGSQVIITKYALNNDYAEYLRTLVIEGQWKGGYFEESSGTISGNISNGAHGYFAACTVLADTLIAQ